MSLILCPECGLSISDKAVACPHCGYPLSSDSSMKPDEQPQNTTFASSPETVESKDSVSGAEPQKNQYKYQYKPRKNSNKTCCWIAVIVLLFFAIVFAALIALVCFGGYKISKYLKSQSPIEWIVDSTDFDSVYFDDDIDDSFDEIEDFDEDYDEDFESDDNDNTDSNDALNIHSKDEPDVDAPINHAEHIAPAVQKAPKGKTHVNIRYPSVRKTVDNTVASTSGNKLDSVEKSVESASSVDNSVDSANAVK